MPKTVVVALGGNALGNNPEEQLLITKTTAKSLVNLIEEGYRVVVCHGNGPQVGMIQNAFGFAHESKPDSPAMPLPECSAMSQGYIGYHLQLALISELKARGINKKVTSLVTETLVDANDQAFSNPSKPVGPFYTKEQAEKIAKEKGYHIIEDAGRGYRRVVASPKPTDILSKEIIIELMHNDHLVIAAGGGGVPVSFEGNQLVGKNAVIDKDLASSLLATIVKADMFVVLTAVEFVAIRFNKPDQKNLHHLDLATAQKYMDDGEFAKGSMAPKVLACMEFLKNNPGKKAIITSLEKAHEALSEKTGTIITG